MLTLDRKRPYGTINPPWSGNAGEFDRAAHFSQDGKWFDGQGLEIIVGKPLERKPPTPVSPRKTDAINSPFELLQRHKELPLKKLRERAEVILASLVQPCPKSREAILEALLGALETHRRSHE
jgi:hypothetical protein